MPNTYTELLRTTVGTATSSVTLNLTGISGYTDLVLVASTLTGNDLADFTLRFNSDSGSNYSTTSLEGQGTSAVSQRQSNQSQMYFVGFQSGTYTEPFTSILQIMNYSNTTTNKTVLTRSSSNAASAYVGLWRSTAAITSIALTSVSSTFSVGSTFSLYGIANADQGAAKATGGIITEDSQYWYHTFGASGAFIPKQSLTCDVLVVAGGGGTTGQAGGGGGAGGLLVQTGRSVPVATYNITVGAGGPGSANNNVVASNGTNTVFDTCTAVGGGYGGAGSPSLNPASGGSGGGGAYNLNTSGSGTQGNSGGATGYGFAGAVGGSNNGAGGGGGAGAVGTAGASNGGAGGIGRTDSLINAIGAATGAGQLSGGNYYFSGGGGGGVVSGTIGAGGAGGGGTGGNYNTGSPDGTAGTVNTGGGAGGRGTAGAGFAGGSGVVIVRYSK